MNETGRRLQAGKRKPEPFDLLSALRPTPDG
jgi:hypothetical protein